MGGGRFDADDWKGYTTTRGYASKTTDEIFSSRKLVKALNPKGVKVRESCDSKDNPLSTPIILALDVTGSMGMIADTIARDGLPVLMKEIYDRKPVTDPHLMFMGIGDVECDSAPLQISQFEADIRIAKQLEELYLEHGGGGNMYESYGLAWYFAAMHTKIESFEKRKKKGYLFTFGDEEPTPSLSKQAIERFIGDTPERDLSCSDLLTMASRQWEVFHVMIKEGSNYREKTRKEWTDLIGQRAIPLSDYKKLAEVVVSILQVNEGADATKVVGSWDGKTALVVKDAVKVLAKHSKKGEIVKL